jgi:hypothetical protein
VLTVYDSSQNIENAMFTDPISRRRISTKQHFKIIKDMENTASEKICIALLLCVEGRGN